MAQGSRGLRLLLFQRRALFLFLVLGVRIPATATAVSVNVVAASPTHPGFLTIFPGGTTQPATSTMNYNAGKIRANNAIVSLGAAGDINAFCGQLAGTTGLIIDVSGYFQ